MPTDTELGKRWKADEEAGWKTWDASQTNPVDMYRLLSSAITPRPIAFVSTVAPDGVRNLAPLSFFQMVAFKPPLVMISCTIPRNRPKDTRENILSTKEFVLNLISEPFIEAANSCSVEAPAYVDEWIVSGLKGMPSVQVKPERVQDSAVSLECTYYSHQDIIPDGEENPSTTIIIGRVQLAHVRNSVLQPDGLQADPTKLRILSRLGGDTYARVSEGFDIPRPSWKEVKEKIGDKL
ncbi:hypothetical protein K488DRAFT_89787 [Vararia minispora EC-137]|uniref:Uncharacterized protein n=1 Tax=Vararia minispora EC-137 TaxID=1314806 RepID=A0ACB8Q982_9AGAM|nr:hypothetical protein K488DRAFT_89787 [Vararia minispora EC-137]